MKTKTKQKIVTRFLNEGADGIIYVSKRPMSQKFYMTPQILKCVQTKRTKITRNGVYVGAICITTADEILKIVEIINRDGYELNYDFRKKRRKFN